MSYSVAFSAAQRGNWNQGGQDFEVFIDNTSLGLFRPNATSYAELTTASFTVSAGAHVLQFVGRNTSGGDNTAFLDAVRVTSATGAGANLALNKPAQQSSDYWGSGNFAGEAVNGNTADLTHTAYQSQPWWQVDLGSVQQIESVKLWNRVDCCQERLANFYLFISEAAFVAGDVTSTVNQAGVSSYYVAGAAPATLVQAVGRSGRFVRVQLTGSNYLSLAEVEVIGGAGGSGSVQWLVADHLGTPRMVIDQTGSLAGVKRHDYAPFGEELFAGAGGRTTAQGYSGTDNVRQQFTGYERDSETGLDFAQARYYASQQGRFTSPDPLLASGRIADPQTWNRYAYVGNNPLRYIDPSGLDRTYPREQDDDVREQEEKKRNQQQQQAPIDPQEVIRIQANDPKLLDFSVKYHDRTDQGEVPVGGEFEIKYKYSISIPTDGTKPEDAGRIEPVSKTGTFTDANNLGLVSVSTKVNEKKESVVVEKTERYVVEKNPEIKSGNTYTINYRIVVTAPNTAPGDVGKSVSRVSSFDRPLFGPKIPQPIEVRNVPVKRKR